MIRPSSRRVCLLVLLSTLAACGQDAKVAAPETDDAADVAALPDLTEDVPAAPVDVQSDVAKVDAAALDVPAAGTPCTVDSDCADADIPCTQARCDLWTQRCALVHVAEGTACEDGDSCTIGDVCKAGQCQGGLGACNCQTGADCAALDDGNACNGTWVCDTAATPSHCTVNPASVVKCPVLLDDPCHANVCNAVTGACEATATNEGGGCEDGFVCTTGDHCQAGQCVPGPSTCACQKNADCPDDADLCNGKPYCDKASLPFTCQINPGTVVTCAKTSDTACASHACDPKTGQCALVPLPDAATCEDGSVCTQGDHCQDGQCAPGQDLCSCQKDSDCGKFEDGDACNGSLYCNVKVFPHICAVNPASVVTCQSVNDTACLKNQCQPQSGQCQPTPVAEGQACDDGNACTQDETCATGKCKAATNLCPCQGATDCATKDDGNLCNGTLFCDKSKVPYVCEVNPATVISCPIGQDSACQQNQCQPATGKCAMTPAALGKPCEEGNLCTQGDVCKDGACSPGPNTCSCQKDADCPDDGDACNGVLFCNKASKVCQLNPNSVVVCAKALDTACLANTCDPQTGACLAKAVHEGLSCDADSNPCTVGDVCKGGKCAVGINTCSCQGDGDCAVFEDGNACNGKLFCDKSKVPYQCAVNPATVVQCPAKNVGACKTNACNPGNGQCGALAVADDTPCDDQKACTIGDVCAAGACIPGTNICGCQADGDCAAQEDGNWCNGTLFCDKSGLPFQCKVNPATIVICPGGQDSTCLKSQCVPSSGACQFQAASEGSACDDANVCTSADTCALGECVGVPKACDDGNVCSVDDCDAVDGCTTLAEEASACSDGDACTADACDPKAGCTHAILASGPCDDGNACTAGDACTNGQCLGLGNGCDDANPCTDDACVGKGCTHTANVVPCGEGQQCIGGTCGGCLAFRRVHRVGCEEIVGNSFDAAVICAANQNQQREEFEAVTRLSDGRIAAVGAASTDKSNQTLGLATVLAPNGKLAWDKTAGKAGTDRLLAVSATTDGGLFAAGVTLSGGPIARPWLLRLAADGSILSSTVLAVTGSVNPPARFDGVTTLPDGGVIAVGAQDAQASGATSTDALVARFDPAGKLVWQKLLGVQSGAQKPSVDHLWAVRVTPDGTGVVAVGERAQPKSPTQQQDGWAVRLDLAGNIVWHTELGGTARDALFGLAFAEDGGVVAVGSTNKATPTAQADGWLVRLNATGAVQSKDVLTGSGDDVLRGVVRTLQGDWVAVGRMDVDHTGDPTWTNGYDVRHAWVLRWDAKWKLLWNKRFDALGQDRLAGVTALPNGDVATVGDTRLGTLPDKPDALVLRVDAQGQDLCGCHLYGKQTSAAGPSVLQSVVHLEDDSAIAVGTTTDAAGVTDGWLTGYTADGETLWEKTVGGPGNDALYDMVRDGKGGLVAVGDTASGLGGADGWIVRFAEGGQIASQVTIDRGDDDHIQSVATLPGAVTGSVDGYLLSGWSSGGSAGKLDGWLVKLDAAGKTLWSKAIGGKFDDRFYSAVRLGSGNLLAVGDSGGGNDPFGGAHVWWAVLSADGVLISQEYKVLGYVDNLNAVEAMADGGAIAAGVTGEVLGRGDVVYRFDALGQQTLKTPPNSGYYLNGVVPMADGGWIGVGHTGGTPYAARWDAKAGKVWTSVISYAGIGVFPDGGDLNDAALLADGSLTAVGQFLQAKGPKNALRIRIHAKRGHSLAHNECKTQPQCERLGCDQDFGCVVVHDVVPCDDGNACTGGDTCSVGNCSLGNRDAQVVTCDDGNPCTSDSCSIAQGCFATPANVTSACSPTQTCSPGGSCGACATASLSFGGSGNSAMNDAALLADGSLLAVGRRQDPGANPDGWIVRVGADDQVLLQKPIASTVPAKPGLDEQLNVLIPGTNGAGWAVGWQVLADGSRDAWSLQFAADGTSVWQKLQTGAGNQAWYGAVRTLQAGQIVAVGEDQGAAWIAGLASTDGALAWQVKLPAPNKGEFFRSAAALPDGGLIAVGRKNVNSADGRAIRLGANHAVIWEADLATPTWFDELVAVAAAPDSGCAAVGYKSYGTNDPWIVRLDAGGKVLWNYLPVISDHQILYAVLFAGQDVIAAGTGDPSVANLTRLDPNGKVLWSKTVRSSGAGSSTLLGLAAGPGELFTAVGTGYVPPIGEEAWQVRFDGAGHVLCGP